MPTKHKLSNKDLTAMTADCEVCGKGVELEKVGKGKGYRCKQAAREIRRQYAQRNADKKGGPSKHSLRGGTTCPLCGPVEPVPWGRGFMCPNRAKELGWKPADAIAPRCHRCDTFLIHGQCQFCTPLRCDLPDDLHIGELPLTGRNENAVDGWKVIGPPLPPDSPWAKYLLDMEV